MIKCVLVRCSSEWRHLETAGRLHVVLPDFLLGEQSHSLQLLQLRDSVLYPLLNDLRHLVHAVVTGSDAPVISVILQISMSTFESTLTMRLSAKEQKLSSTHVWKLWYGRSSGSVCKMLPSGNAHQSVLRQAKFKQVHAVIYWFTVQITCWRADGSTSLLYNGMKYHVFWSNTKMNIETIGNCNRV